MIKIKATVTYKVPEWSYCNHIAGLTKVSKETCRFCVKTGKGNYSCALHNMPLSVEQGYVVSKCPQCVKAGLSRHAEVTEETGNATANINPKDVIKATVTEYRKAYKSMIAQGYPDVVADKLAQKVLLGGKWHEQ